MQVRQVEMGMVRHLERCIQQLEEVVELLWDILIILQKMEGPVVVRVQSNFRITEIHQDREYQVKVTREVMLKVE
jgi:hypothetical protein